VNRLRVLLVDDHNLLREGLKLLVNAQPDMVVVGEAQDGPSACRLAQELVPEIILMDISMPGGSGLPATERIKEICPDAKIIILTRHAEKTYIWQMLQRGASGYVIKRAAADELIHAIRSVAVGGVYVDPSIAGQVMNGLVQNPSYDAQQTGSLSDREIEVLRMTAWGHANKEIAGTLNISIKTVETHKTHIMQKLSLKSRAELVRYALRQGWLEDN